jgi:hypothetical protein
MGKAVGLDARLRIDGAAVGIRAFTFDAPANSLGYSLNVTLSDPATEIADDASIDFDLVAIGADASESAVSYMTGGLIDGRQTTIERNGDVLQFTAINPLADKWQLCPEQSLYVYDPARTDAPEQETADDERALRDEDGQVIAAEIRQQRDLDLDYILRLAYVEGCGFADVVTNIKSYPVKRADFPLTESFHKAASRFVSIFEPQFFADDLNNRLYIIDCDGQLPAGLAATVRRVTPNKYKESNQGQPSHNIINRVILRYLVDPGDSTPKNGAIIYPPTSKVRLDPDFMEVGQFNQAGHAAVLTERYIREWYAATAPFAKTDEREFKVVITSWGYDPETQRTELLSIDTQADEYSRDWKLKKGYSKTIEARLKLPYSATKALVTAYTESNFITWKRSAWNPDDVQKVWDVTTVAGLVVCEGDPAQPSALVPIIEASRNGSITIDETQTIQQRDMACSMEFIRKTGLDQMDLHRVRIDLLRGQIESSKVTQPVASPVIQSSNPLQRPQPVRSRDRQRAELIVDKASIALYGPREPFTLDSGDVPYEQTLPIAKRIIKRKGAPPASVSFILNNFDAAIRRGSLRFVEDRETVGQLYMVLSYRIAGDKLGMNGSLIYQECQCAKVVND